MEKKIVLLLVALLALAFLLLAGLGILGSKLPPVSEKENRWRGPTGQPYVKGPTGPPPSY